MYICVYSDMPGIAKIRVSVRQSALDLFSKPDRADAVPVHLQGGRARARARVTVTVKLLATARGAGVAVYRYQTR